MCEMEQMSQIARETSPAYIEITICKLNLKIF